MEFSISSVCWAALASMAATFCLAGGLGTGPAPDGCCGLTFRARAWQTRACTYVRARIAERSAEHIQ